MSCFPCIWLKKKFKKRKGLTAEDLLGDEREYYENIRKQTEKQFRESYKNNNY